MSFLVLIIEIYEWHILFGRQMKLSVLIEMMGKCTPILCNMYISMVISINISH